jgi:uncharacterized membrane protein
MKTPAESILANLLEVTGAAVGLIYGYSSDRTRLRLVASIGTNYALPAWDEVTDCWADRLASHDRGESYEVIIGNLKVGGICRQRYLDMGCDYSLSFPIFREGKLVGFVAALWRSVPTISRSHRNDVLRAALSLTEVVDDAGYPKAASLPELAAAVKSVTAEYGSIVTIQIGIAPDQEIIYWKDTEDFFGFGDNLPIGMNLSQFFVDSTFGAQHQTLVDKFLGGGGNCRAMNLSRPISVKSSTGQSLQIVIGLLRRVSAHNTYCALALAFPVKTLVGGAIVPDLPGDDRVESRVGRGVDVAVRASEKLNNNWRGGMVIAAWGIVFGLLALLWFGKLPIHPPQAPAHREAKP